ALGIGYLLVAEHLRAAVLVDHRRLHPGATLFEGGPLAHRGRPVRDRMRTRVSGARGMRCMGSRLRIALVVVCVIGFALAAAPAHGALPRIDTSDADRCDFIAKPNNGLCLLPFPDDYYTV